MVAAGSYSKMVGVRHGAKCGCVVQSVIATIWLECALACFVPNASTALCGVLPWSVT